jgi:hypothetical protein
LDCINPNEKVGNEEELQTTGKGNASDADWVVRIAKKRTPKEDADKK